MLEVPVSSELRAEMRVALPHPMIHQYRFMNVKSLAGNQPVFCIECTLPIGKIVIFPGVNVAETILAPFS